MTDFVFPTTGHQRWAWPKAPGAAAASRSDDGAGQACRIETGTGEVIEGTLLGFDPALGALKYRRRGDTWSVTLPFWRLRRLTLTLPTALDPGRAPSRGGASSAAAPAAYHLQPAESGQPALTGSTLGHVRAREGLYLFAPLEDAAAVQRIFIPNSAFSSYKFGPSAEQAAHRRGIADPAELLVALAEQERLSVAPLGQSLIKMGLLSQAQLDAALASQREDRLPLGEMLVGKGLITRTDLQRALAGKMGYPEVDLVRFPIDPLATRKLPLALAIKARAAPLMIDGKRLIVAIDKPSRTVKLRQFETLTGLTLVPVMAPRNLILDVLTIMSEHGQWQGVPMSLRFFPTTH